MLGRREFIAKTLVLGGALIFIPLQACTSDSSTTWEPAYALAERSGWFQHRVEEAYSLFQHCEICPQLCGVDRTAGDKGFCRAPLLPVVHGAQPHFGEEAPLVGRRGSGTIFFSNCSLRCVFCQNWPIAHEGQGKMIKEAELANMMLRLQNMGCHNINLVTPTHVMPNILKAVRLAHLQGLRLPLVYNTSGYERPEMIRLLDGLVDIYLPDFKFWDSEHAAKFTGGDDYPEMVRQSIVEMNRQVGLLQMDWTGVARRGVILRHLVMPNRVAGTQAMLQWVSENLPLSTYINIMPQYRVAYKAFEYPAIARGITMWEFQEAIEWAYEVGLTNMDQRSRQGFF